MKRRSTKKLRKKQLADMMYNMGSNSCMLVADDKCIIFNFSKCEVTCKRTSLYEYPKLVIEANVVSEVFSKLTPIGGRK